MWGHDTTPRVIYSLTTEWQQITVLGQTLPTPEPDAVRLVLNWSLFQVGGLNGKSSEA